MGMALARIDTGLDDRHPHLVDSIRTHLHRLGHGGRSPAGLDLDLGHHRQSQRDFSQHSVTSHVDAVAGVGRDVFQNVK